MIERGADHWRRTDDEARGEREETGRGRVADGPMKMGGSLRGHFPTGNTRSRANKKKIK